MTKKKNVEEESAPVAELDYGEAGGDLAPLENEAAEQEETVSAKTVEEKLLEYYEARESGQWTLREASAAVGEDEATVALTWHRLFDAGKVPSPTFTKP